MKDKVLLAIVWMLLMTNYYAYTSPANNWSTNALEKDLTLKTPSASLILTAEPIPFTNMLNTVTNGFHYGLVLSTNSFAFADPFIRFRLDSIGAGDTIIIGPVSICATNGRVTIDPNVPLDEASSNFWKALERAYPYVFPNYEGLNKSNPPKMK